MRRFAAMAEWPISYVGSGGLVLSLPFRRASDGVQTSVFLQGLRAGNEGGRESKIKADPPKGRHVIVCTSFFVEIAKIVRDWREILWRRTPRNALEILQVVWRQCFLPGCNRLGFTIARDLASSSLGGSI